MSLLYFQVPDPRPDKPSAAVIPQLELLGPPRSLGALRKALGLSAKATLAEAYATLAAFQRAHGLIADGMVGPYNRRLLASVHAAKAAAFSGWLGCLPPEMLSKLFPFTLRKNLQIYAPYVLAALDEAGYSPSTAEGVLMCKVAMASIRAGCEGFEPLNEAASRFNTPPPGTPGGVPFSLYDPPYQDAARLGNTQAGDGARFKGRGFIQLTGHGNYLRLGEQLQLPLTERPFLANLPEAAAVVLVTCLQNQAPAILAAMREGQPGEACHLIFDGSQGLDRFTDACSRWDSHLAPLLARPARRGAKRSLAAAAFSYAQFANADDRFALPVKSDTVDLRDLPYRPPLGSLPDMFPPPAIVDTYWDSYRAYVLNQGQEGACTGFGLACVINYLGFSRVVAAHAATGGRRKPLLLDTVVKVSPRMLYEFARRYDEFDGSDYEGSSCRGALKGWHKHGVCSQDDWPYEGLVPANTAWARHALDTTLGVYYRVDKKNLVDLQAAINEVGAVYVSAQVHEGWDPASLKVAKGTAVSHANLPRIRFTRGQTQPSGAHAFALVGYNRSGFIVQNSWGADWGLSGFAVLGYEDWLAHSMDAWAATLGVPGVVNNAAAMPGEGLPKSRLGKAAGSQFFSASAPPDDPAVRHSLVLDRGMPSKLPTADMYQPGSLGTLGQDWPRQWFAAHKPKGEPARIVLYAHGGLNSEEDGLKRARLMAKPFLDNGCYPLFLVWKTGPIESLVNALKGKAEDPRLTGNWFSDHASDPLLEKTVGPALARPLWNEMKYAAQIANTEQGGLTQLASSLQSLLVQVPDLEVHLIGHSAGSLLLGPMIESLKKRRIPVASAHLFAPACTVGFANKHWLPHVGPRDTAAGTFPLWLSLLSDARERDDNVVWIYRKSLLYLVARGIEEGGPVPLLGMEGSWSPGKVFGGWSGDGATLAALRDLARTQAELAGRGLNVNVLDGHRVFTRTHADGRAEPGQSVPAAHGAFDGDAPLVLQTIERIRGAKALNPELDLSGVP